jgi:hypothetical protein
VQSRGVPYPIQKTRRSGHTAPDPKRPVRASEDTIDGGGELWSLLAGPETERRCCNQQKEADSSEILAWVAALKIKRKISRLASEKGK